MQIGIMERRVADTRFSELMGLIKAIQASSGQTVLNEIEGVQRSFGVVKRNYDELINAILAFQNEKEIPRLWPQQSRDVRHEAMDVVVTRLQNFLAAAFSLVDHVRRHRKHLYSGEVFEVFNEGNAAQLQSLILGRPEHWIAQGLRIYTLHVGLPPISFVLQGRGGELVGSKFQLSKDDLLKWDGWSSQARRSIEGGDHGITLEEFIKVYFNQLSEFYAWLWRSQSAVHSEEIEAANILRDEARALHEDLYGPIHKQMS